MEIAEEIGRNDRTLTMRHDDDMTILACGEVSQQRCKTAEDQ